MNTTDNNNSTDFRILLVDDHALFRQGLKFLLADLESNIIFFEAENCDDARQYAASIDNPGAQRSAPMDLVLLDYHFPGEASEQEALTQIKETFTQTTVVVLSSKDDPATIQSAISGGAAGFIPKSSTPEIMIAALKLVLAGGIYLPPQAQSPDYHKAQAPTGGDGAFAQLTEQLSERQLQALMGALQGKPNKIIARELDIAEGTVKAHLSVAFRLLDVKNRTEAVYLAAKLGLKL